MSIFTIGIIALIISAAIGFACHIRDKRALANWKREQSARNATKSRKHIRITYGAFEAKITYYGSNGRKVTSRKNVRLGDVARLAGMARNAGYRVI